MGTCDVLSPTDEFSTGFRQGHYGTIAVVGVPFARGRTLGQGGAGATVVPGARALSPSGTKRCNTEKYRHALRASRPKCTWQGL